eukprot:TRINITY_DN6245_c0_g1_i9.p1 TRINITY_DN6245_c0_g1~~TRINITY_DN6245_c0_g1_i9.p1  ORF type:complete len:606 (+),score=64.12 TRINITY_DN6245_c0_g1_i9:60-1877(+)
MANEPVPNEHMADEPVPNERVLLPSCLPPQLEVDSGDESPSAAEYSHSICNVASLRSRQVYHVDSSRSVSTAKIESISDTTTPADLCRLSQLGMRLDRLSRASPGQIDADPSFELHEPEFIRAVRLAAALGMAGKHWRDNSGSDLTFNLSRPCTSIDVFFSHSWRSRWWLKVLAILYYFNGTSACAAALVVHVIMLSLALAEHDVPWFNEGVGLAFVLEADQVMPVSFNFRYIPACLAFFVVFFFKQVIAFGTPNCFLDKMCINQTDVVKKDKGVRQLGVLLRYSEHMMVLWQPEYLTRLWCVFELAAFTYLHGHKQGSLVFYPLKLPLLAMCLCMFHFAASFGLTILSPLTLHSEWHMNWVSNCVHPSLRYVYLWAVYFVICFAGLYCIPAFCLWRFCKLHIEDGDTIYSQLVDFKVSRTQCFLEEDREYVTSCIRRWFDSTGRFEDYVQQELRKIVLQHRGENLRLPFSLFVVGSLSHLLIGTNFVVDCLLAGANMSAASTAIVTVFITFCSDSLALHLTLRLAASDFGYRQPGFFASSIIVGPLATACLFSAANATGLAMLIPCIPLWTAACILLLFTGANLLVTNPELLSKCFTRAKRGLV